MREFENLGKFMKEHRVQNGLTQSELANKLELHSQFVSNWERGLCAPPAHVFQKMISLLKIDREELVEVMLGDSKKGIEAKVYKIKSKRKSS